MKRTEIENILKENGFNARPIEGALVLSIYEKKGTESVDVIINETEDLFCNCLNFLKIEVNDDGVCIRLFYDIFYVGCIVKSYDEIETFEIDEWDV